MENPIDKDMAVFHQICEINELDPKAISEEAQHRFAEQNRQAAEQLIWTAFNHRARALMQDVLQETGSSDEMIGDKAAYTIDADPAAPAFVVNEDAIRREYSPDIAAKIIDALNQVQLPVTG